MDHIRHSGIFDASHTSVTLVGAGGIGAMTGLVLAKMGVHDLVVYDSDIVSVENMATQLHRLQDLDRLKVHALNDVIQAFSDDTTIYPCDQRVQANMQLYGDVIISGVDSIQARKDIWQAVKNGRAKYYLDARMSAEEFHLYCVPMHNLLKVDKYEKLISGEDDTQIAEIPCTSKATFYTAAIAAGHVGSAVRKICTGFTPAYYMVHNIFRDKLLVLEQ